MYYSLCLFSALCALTLHRSTTNMCKTVGLHDSLVLWSLNALTLALAPGEVGELSSTNCQKGPSTIRLRYPVPGTVLAGTGFEKNGRISGQPEPDIRYIPTVSHTVRPFRVGFGAGIGLYRALGPRQKLHECHSEVLHPHTSPHYLAENTLTHRLIKPCSRQSRSTYKAYNGSLYLSLTPKFKT